MATKLDVVGRTVYRAILKRAKQFDKDPVLKALITRNLADDLPLPLDAAVAKFLGDGSRLHYWPKAEGAPDSVVGSLQDAFRNPPPLATVDGAFQGLRYLTALLSVAEKHSVLEHCGATAVAPDEAAPAAQPSISGSAAAEPRLQPAALQMLSSPQKGALLVAHPSLDGWFKRAVVILCQHDPTRGAYGLCLNKPLGGSVRDLIGKICELKEGGQGGQTTSAAQLVGSLASLLATAPMQLKSWSPEGEPPHFDLPSTLLHAMAGATAALQEDEGGLSLLGMLRGEDDDTPHATAAAFLGAQGRGTGMTLGATPGHVLRRHVLDMLMGAIEGGRTDDEEEEDEDEGGDDEDEEGVFAELQADEPFALSGDESGEDDVWGSGGEADLSRKSFVVVLNPLQGSTWLAPLLDIAKSVADRPSTSMPAASKGAPAAPMSPTAAELYAAFRDVASSLNAPSEGNTSTSHQGSDPQQQQQQREEEEAEGEREDNDPRAPFSACQAANPAPGSASSSSSSSSIYGADSSSGASEGSWQSTSSTGGGSSSDSGGSVEQPSSSGGGGSMAGGTLGGAGLPGSSWAEGGAAWEEGGATVGQVLALFNGSKLLRGGPVEGLQLLHRSAELGSEAVLQPDSGQPGVFVGANLSSCPELVRQGKLAPEDVMVFVGDCGWFGPPEAGQHAQLEQEVQGGTWAVVRADAEVAALFNCAQQEGAQEGGEGADDMWSRLLSALGPRHAAMARIPKGVWQDLQHVRV